MKSFVDNIITFLIALVGLIGGAIWTILSQFAIEPIILTTVSFLEIAGFVYYNLISDKPKPETKPNKQGNINTNTVNVSVGVSNKLDKDVIALQNIDHSLSRDNILDVMKLKIKILFIDDDKNFNVVRILKDSGYKNTKTVIDVKSVDSTVVKDTDIFFVDINGVGKTLNLTYEGLDLALMLKQRYPYKIVVIYSANKTFNSFHAAWEECDYKLEKNALPYQFQNIVEESSLKFYAERK